MTTKKPMPEKLEAELISAAESPSTGARKATYQNKEFGITLVVTWSQPYPDIGLQQFTCKALPGYVFNNYEAMRTTYAEKVLAQ